MISSIFAFLILISPLVFFTWLLYAILTYGKKQKKEKVDDLFENKDLQKSIDKIFKDDYFKQKLRELLLESIQKKEANVLLEDDYFREIKLRELFIESISKEEADNLFENKYFQQKLKEIVQKAMEDMKQTKSKKANKIISFEEAKKFTKSRFNP